MARPSAWRLRGEDCLPSLMTTLEAHLLYIDTSEYTKTGASVTTSQGLGTYVLTVQHSAVHGSVFQYLMDPLDLYNSVPT